MRCKIDVEMHYRLSTPAEVLLALQVIPMADQTLISDNLTITGAQPLRSVTDLMDRGTRTWFSAAGDVEIGYTAEAEVERAATRWHGLAVAPRVELPADALPYLFPSRYCEADRLEQFVLDTFGAMKDGAQVEAMADWLYEHLSYTPGASTPQTTAVDTFLSRRGVCRDYAHLMISFARAAGVPARAVSVYAPGLDPQDFHAVAEVYLEGGWHLIDASHLAPEEHFVRMATGRDATDISFMTIFGHAQLVHQQVRAEAVAPA